MSLLPSHAAPHKTDARSAMSAGDYAAAYAGRGSSREGTLERARRSAPRIWDTDWLVLRAMHRHIAELSDRVSRRGSKAIDFGCGSKPYESLFTEKGMIYRGADFGVDAEIGIDDTGRLAASDASADLVLSFQVLEHVRDIDTYLAEAARVLKRDGSMLLSTHGTWLYHPHPEDHRRWTREGLVGDLNARGFTVEECIPIVGPLAWTTMIRLTCASFALRGVPIVGPGLTRALAVVMNLRALAEDAITPRWVTAENACIYLMLCRRAGPVAKTDHMR